MLWCLCRDRHKGHENAVHLNDVFFAGHGAILVALTFAQCFIYERGNQSVSRICSSVIGAASFAAMVSICLVLFDSSRFPMLTFLYYLSWVKMGVTFFKYMPQVCMHVAVSLQSFHCNMLYSHKYSAPVSFAHNSYNYASNASLLPCVQFVSIKAQS